MFDKNRLTAILSAIIFSLLSANILASISPLESHVTNAESVLTQPIIFSHPQGFYSKKFDLALYNNFPGSIIRYTLNGSEPGLQSPVYSGPFEINTHGDNHIGISHIPTNPSESPKCWIWNPPRETVRTGVVVKAKAFIGHAPISNTFAQTYFIGFAAEEFGVPIISILTDSMNLFGYETGLYVPGITYDQNPLWEDLWGAGNYHNRGDEWERPAVITIFDKQGMPALHQNVGIRIHGGGTRSMPVKTLRVYARDSYGGDYMHHAFFPDKAVASFKRIILRNSGQDFKNSYLTDALSHVLVKHLDLETQSYQPAIVFINGEYWGIHNIRDRIDKYYLEYQKGADPNAIDLLTGNADVEEGSNASYFELIDFMQNNDISNPAVYQKVSKLIDMGNFIDYNISKQYIAVEDWPGNNVDFWRPHTPEGRWRWIYYDNDGAFVNYDQDFIAINTLENGTAWPNPDWSTFLFRTLLKNELFRQSYIDRYSHHLEHTFATKRVLTFIDSLAAGIRPLIPEHIQRWTYPKSVSIWESRINRMRKFAMTRPCIVRKLLVDYFDLDEAAFLPDICTATEPENLLKSQHTQHEAICSTEASLLIYPNPANGPELIVEYHGPQPGHADILLYDLTGRLIYAYNRAFQHDTNSSVTLSISGFSPGIYLLVVRSPLSVISQKFMIP